MYPIISFASLHTSITHTNFFSSNTALLIWLEITLHKAYIRIKHHLRNSIDHGCTISLHIRSSPLSSVFASSNISLRLPPLKSNFIIVSVIKFARLVERYPRPIIPRILFRCTSNSMCSTNSSSHAPWIHVV